MQQEEERIENEEVVAEVSRDEREEEAAEAQQPQAAPHGPPHPVHQGREEDATWFQVRGAREARIRMRQFEEAQRRLAAAVMITNYTHSTVS